MPARKAARQPLDRRAVLSAAVALADRDGVETVSMRRLAEVLGVVPMALYKHVADKEDLLDGMVELIVGSFSYPAEDVVDWRTAARETVLAARRGLAAHPWARRVIETRTLRTPAVLGHMESMTQVFLRAGFSADLTHHIMHALGNRIWGFSPELFPSNDAGERRHTSASPDPADYPGIMAITADARSRRPATDGCDEEFEFLFALDLILNAVETLHEEGWVSPTR